MKKHAATLLFSLCILTLWAQETPKQSVTIGLSGGYWPQNPFAVDSGYPSGLTLFSIPITYAHQIAQVKGLYYTIGVRQNLAFGDQTFTINNQDALIDDISNYSLNVMAGLEYHYQKMFVGFNIDLIGINVGTRSYKTVGTDPVYKITPEVLNLVGSSGCTNNEFYVGYSFTESFAAKVGVSYYNMTLLYSSQKIAETSAYTSVLLPMLNVQYTLWQQK